jgi:hypothetical protein
MLKSLAIPDLNLYYMRAVQPSQTEPVIVAQSGASHLCNEHKYLVEK